MVWRTDVKDRPMNNSNEPDIWSWAFFRRTLVHCPDVVGISLLLHEVWNWSLKYAFLSAALGASFLQAFWPVVWDGYLRFRQREPEGQKP
jgi:hypothetical protein